MYERWSVVTPYPALEIICARRDHAPIAYLRREGDGWSCFNRGDGTGTSASFTDLDGALDFAADGTAPIPDALLRDAGVPSAAPARPASGARKRRVG